MAGHGTVRTALRDYLERWVPLRLLLLRDAEGLTKPDDPRCYLLDDKLPDNDPSLYPAVIVSSSRTLAMTRRRAPSAGVEVVYDVDYEMTVMVAVTRHEFAADEQASLDRDILLQAVRECLLLPADLGGGAELIGTPAEVTGAATQTVRATPLSAGTATVVVRAAEALLPNEALATIVGADLTVIPKSADQSL